MNHCEKCFIPANAGSVSYIKCSNSNCVCHRNRLTDMDKDEAEKLIKEGVITAIPQQPNDWEKELKKLGFGGLARITLKPFITSLLSTQKEEWISKIEKMKTPLDESDDSAYHRDIGFNDAINDIISLIKKTPTK